MGDVNFPLDTEARGMSNSRASGDPLLPGLRGGDLPDWDGARFIVGDTRQVLKTLPDASVDLVLTSPPFLALRSYLPSDDPNKPMEIGQEGGPGAFIDALLDVVEECRRVLKPTGTLAFELGDTYSGSGGAGGDYNEGGMRDGQPKFRAGYVRNDRENRQPQVAGKVATKANGHPDRDGPPRPARSGRRVRSEDEQAGILAPRGRPGPEGRDNIDGWPLDKSMCLVPEVFRFALAYGFNPLTGRSTPRWRVRNVVRWCRPNPPVGRLGDKFRPATSDMVIACTDRNRFFDLAAVSEPSDVTTPGGLRKGSINGTDETRARAGETRQTSAVSAAGAPPLDYWVVPTQPYAGSHYAAWPENLLKRPITAMCPMGGVVLDPFAGSGTTLGVALGLGRRAIGIDLDRRNADLAYQRVGMFLSIEEAA